MRYLRTSLLWLCGACVTVPGYAELMALPGDKTAASQIRLAERRNEPGKWGRAEARLRGDTERRYYVRGLKVAAPLSVQVIAERTDAPVRVSLHRHAWVEALQTGSTGTAGIFRFDGRAHGNVGLRLQSETGEPVRATVLVWQGEPVPRSLAAVYAAPGTARAAEAGMRDSTDGGGVAWWVPVAVLAALVALGAGWWLGRRSRAAAAVVVGLALIVGGASFAPPASAQISDKPKGFDEDKASAPRDKPAPKPEPPKSPPKPDPKPAPPPNPFDVPPDSGWEPSGGSTPVEPKDDAAPADTGDADEPWPEEPEAADAGSYRERIAAAEAHARELANQVANNRAEIERLRLLIESDRRNEPDPSDLPPLPLSCRPPQTEGDGIQRPGEADAAWDNYEACQQCYRQPLADFERQLELYEQLRVIYNTAKDDMTRSLDLGDKAPKPHTLLENAWAAQKFAIRRAFDGTKRAYDSKLIEFNDKLSEILDRIGVCETEMNNNPMWRQTSGMFFHRTMATSYKRTD